jgi:hypothetical protein
MEDISFNKLNNAQNIEKKIVPIFSKGQPDYILKPQPHFVVLVGSPGVGKTTKAREFLKKELGVDYNNFYNISLDSLVERIKPYRIATQNLYKTIKNKKGQNYKLQDENYALLSEMYLPTIMSKKSNLNIRKTHKRIKDDILYPLIAAARKAETKAKKSKAPANIKAAEDAKQAAAEEIKIKAEMEIAANIATNNSEKVFKTLNDLRKEGLEYGVKNGLNILYDTTLTKSKDKIKQDIMPILEMNKSVKYKITVLLVTAPERDIRKRLEKRHIEMLEESDPYIRAVSPKLVKGFIEDNIIGYENAKKYFTENKYKNEKPDTYYTANDFKFKEIQNPTKNINSINNTNGNMGFRYF